MILLAHPVRTYHEHGFTAAFMGRAARRLWRSFLGLQTWLLDSIPRILKTQVPCCPVCHHQHSLRTEPLADRPHDTQRGKRAIDVSTFLGFRAARVFASQPLFTFLIGAPSCSRSGESHRWVFRVCVSAGLGYFRQRLRVLGSFHTCGTKRSTTLLGSPSDWHERDTKLARHRSRTRNTRRTRIDSE